MQNKLEFKLMEYENKLLFNINNFTKLLLLILIYVVVAVLPFYLSFLWVLFICLVSLFFGFKIKPFITISIIIFLFALTFGLYGFFLYEYNEYQFTIYNTTLSYDFLVVTINLFIKSFVIVMPTLIYSLTSTVTQIEYGLEIFFKPLYKLRFPVGLITLTATLTIGFIPILFREANRILKSQAVRGRDISILSYKDKVLTVIYMLIPLLVSSMVKAQQLSYSITIRKYDAFEPKTYYMVADLTKQNIIINWIIVGLIVCVFVLHINFM